MPKLVRHSHANQVYQAWAVGLMLRTSPGAPLLFGLPLFHVGGALTQALQPLTAGGTLVILTPSGWRNPNSVRNVWRLVERFKPEVFGGVPTVLAAALNVPIESADVSSIRLCFGRRLGHPGRDRARLRGTAACAGARSVWHDRDLELCTRSPMATGRSASVRSAIRCRTAESASSSSTAKGACSGSSVRGQRRSASSRCRVRGVFSGYLSDEHNRNAFVEPGWVNSGDLGRLDADGYLWITGRAKDLIIRGAHNIDPMAIEEVFFQHPAGRRSRRSWVSRTAMPASCRLRSCN
jgi:fatty-acyl-CoA synthase